MDYAMSQGGLLVHSRGDWPCAICRPRDTGEDLGFCICLRCARAIITAAEAGMEGARALLDDVTDALLRLEDYLPSRRLPMN